MKKVIIIDDEPLARQLMLEYLAPYPDLEVVASCADGYEGVKAIIRYSPDLVFLDVQMPRISGFEMLEILDKVPPVIFCTAYDEYAMKAFENNAVDYLLKPFSTDRLAAAIGRWRQMEAGKAEAGLNKLIAGEGQTRKEDSTRIVVRNNTEISIIPVNELVYLEAYDDYVKIFTRDSYFLKKKTMNHYEAVLDPALFFRTHRSFIINLSQLTRIEPLEKNTYLALLKTGAKIPLSRSGYLRLKEKLGI